MKKNKILFLIWEGPDEVGKTSTRKMIEKKRYGKDIMIDRFIISNLVYGEIYDRYTDDEKAYLDFKNERLKALINPVLIYLYAPVDVIIERIKRDRHEDIDKEVLEKTIKKYDEYFEKSTYNYKIKIDTSKYNQDIVVRKILNYLNYHVEKQFQNS